MDHSHNKTLTTNDFDYEVPENLIAQEPSKNRGDSKLLIYKQTGMSTDNHFSDLAKLIQQDSLIILNDTKVFSSRLYALNKNEKLFELFLLELPSTKNSEKHEYTCFLKPGKKAPEGTTLTLYDSDLTFTVASKTRDNTKVVFHCPAENLLEYINIKGGTPLPPYIKREKNVASNSKDKERYQTVYANEIGSVAAPTAGLHFSNKILNELKEQGTTIANVTLHVGAGTFLPVKSETIQDHKMHFEQFMVPQETIDLIKDFKDRGKTVICVGTTVLRTLESLWIKAARESNEVDHYSNKWLETDLFLHPTTKDSRYRPLSCDAIITNFHQPKSTLFMLICYLVGFDNAHQIYRTAKQNEFRLFSYGDSSLLYF